MKTKSEPRVRFRGFTDEWSEVTLGDVATFSKGKGLSKDSFSDEGVPCLHYGELFTTYEDNINSVNTVTDIDGDSMIYSEGCEVLVPSSSTVADKAVTASAINIPDVMLGGDINIIKPDSTLNNSFLSLLINYGYRNKVWALVQTGTITHLYNKDLNHLKIRIPSLPEQQAIGKLFQTLDKTIDLSNTQVENLKQQKKALLQRLFPQKGETEPKVRLRGFTDEWNEVKLGDVVDTSTGKLNANAMTSDGAYPFFTCSKDDYLTDTYSFDDEALIIAGNGDMGAVKYYNGKFDAYQRTYVLTEIMCDVKYLEYCLSVNLPKQIHLMTYGSTMPYITKPTLTDMAIRIPSLPEQQAIGELFQTVDEQIRLAEDKVNQYKELKQALLQRLFV